MRKLARDADCPNCCSMYLALKVNSPMKELNFRMLAQRSRKYAGVPSRRFSDGRNPVTGNPLKIQVNSTRLDTYAQRRIVCTVPLAMSVSFRSWLLLTASSGPTGLVSAGVDWNSSPSCLGSERGKNQKGMLETSRRAAETRKPNHQAPTQRASSRVMVILSASWQRDVFEWSSSRSRDGVL